MASKEARAGGLAHIERQLDGTETFHVVQDGNSRYAAVGDVVGTLPVLLNGTVDPVDATGKDGDFYINKVALEIFGPKAGGHWPAGSAILGPAGTNGRTVLDGTVDPVPGVGADGDFYINQATWTIFGPKAAGAWGVGTALAAAQLTTIVRPGTIDPNNLLEFFGRLGARFAYVTTGMVWKLVGIASSTGYAVGELGRRVTDYLDRSVGLAVTDQSGNVYLEAGTKGLKVKALNMETLNGASSAAIATLLGEVPLTFSPATRYLTPTFGQSLAQGTGSTPDPVNNLGAVALTTDQPYGNLMFRGGVRPDDINGFGSGVYDVAALAPHIEQAFGGTDGSGETILGGFQAMLFQLLNAYGMAPINTPFRTVSFAVAQGATGIVGFRSGTAPFTRFMNWVTAAKGLLGGYNVQMPAHFWMQGESGIFDDTYITQLTALAGEVDTQARAILTDQSDAVVTFTYQLDIAMSAHWYTEAQRLSSLVRIVGPMYPIIVAGQRAAQYDETHRGAAGYRYYGAQAAVAWFCQVILKRPWRPLQLSYDARGRLRCQVDGNDLILTYDVPHGGWLEFDVPVAGRALGSARMQKGFYLFAAAGAEKPLRAVTIEGRNKIRLAGSTPPVAGDIVRIGYKDPTVTATASVSVNLRDRQGDVITFDDGGRVPIHNWALAQEHTLTAGELA